MEDPTNSEFEAVQVKVAFTTTDEDIQLPETKRQLLVPADIRRYGLSRILNSESMLDTPRAIPFDFLINGTLLRSTLEEYMKQNALSFETSITLQYVRSLIPPVFEASFEHDDWVSDIDVLSESSPAGRWSGSAFLQGQDRILSASYDGLLRIWNGSGQVIATSPSASGGGHTSGIKSARFLSSSQIASGGLDRTVRIWKYSESSGHFNGDLVPALELYGHKGTVDSIEVDGPSKRILTASSDGSIGLWTTSKASAPAAPESLLPETYATKRRKQAKSVSTPQRGPLSLMAIHKAPASAAVFDPRDRTVAYSASQDHTLRTLDLTTGLVVSTLTASSPLLSLCALPRTSDTPLLAAGTSERNIVLIDPRASAATTSVMTLRGHVNKVVSIAASPDNEHSLVSGSHDGTCRVWDLRITRTSSADEKPSSVNDAVYTIDRESRQGKKRPLAGEGAMVFSVVWDQKWGIISAGADKKVQINRGRDVVSSEIPSQEAMEA